MHSQNNLHSRITGMLGLARRAGRLVIGTEQICRLMPKGNAAPVLVLISERASENTRKKLTTKCEFYGIEALPLNVDMEELGRLLGKTYAPAAVALTDANFAQAIKKLSSEQRG